MRVLIVDDESLIRMDLRDIIESCGHEVVAEGTNGVEAIKLCKEYKPDIVLMDVKLPEFGGPMHGANEAAPIDKLLEALKIYIIALLRLEEIDF